MEEITFILYPCLDSWKSHESSQNNKILLQFISILFIMNLFFQQKKDNNLDAERI